MTKHLNLGIIDFQNEMPKRKFLQIMAFKGDGNGINLPFHHMDQQSKTHHEHRTSKGLLGT